ncbi:hypothetical protein [Vibrio hangzhouensis]|uniref:Uncharacterized protein n=1 Tax=Vibrio hangzhouensis TaxID=462991 RepID=A0A1H5YCD5_9VIBR|nr:hypothetical protein [Vibrio hangzhouensis]SEG21769.1 hypothetical protein SAMN04488244_10918 [Vibrio hangzhouensis]
MDVTYTPSQSIVDLPITDPIHAPCPDMAGCGEFDATKTQRSLQRVAELRKQVAAALPKKSQTLVPARFRQACYGRA